ncbi:hypothetical protein [Vibrio parahaemolyticus]|uniref:hypothetical protein n=1 Tax=Vibrio parahaemolyticus TaxID=670 RepID=UPI003D81AAFC
MTETILLPIPLLAAIVALVIVCIVRIHRYKAELRRSKFFAIQPISSMPEHRMFSNGTLSIIVDSVKYNGCQFYLMDGELVKASFVMETEKHASLFRYLRSSGVRVEQVSSRELGKAS